VPVRLINRTFAIFGPRTIGETGTLSETVSYSFSLFVDGAIYEYNGSRIRHTSWQTLLTIIEAAVIPFVRAKYVSENVRPVARYL
jgi:hypothetical protein